MMDKLINNDYGYHAEIADNDREGFFVADVPGLIISQPDIIGLLCSNKDKSLVTPEAISIKDWLLAVNNNINVWSEMFGDQASKSYARIYLDCCLDKLCQYFPSLITTAGWMMFEVFGEVKPGVIGIAKRQNLGVKSLLEKLWVGSDSHIQCYLLRRHADVADWPSASIFSCAMEAFIASAPHASTGMLTENSRSMGGLFWGEPEDHRYMVANLPVLLGFWSMTGAPMTWWHRQHRLAVVEQVREFDSQWFALAYQHGVMLAVVMDHHYIAAKEE